MTGTWLTVTTSSDVLFMKLSYQVIEEIHPPLSYYILCNDRLRGSDRRYSFLSNRQKLIFIFLNGNCTRAF